MTAVVRADTEELIALLDPERDYGDLSFEQVVERVRAGDLLLSPGYNLPIIRDRGTNHTVRGTGAPIGVGSSPQQAIAAEFRHRAVDDFDFAYRNLLDGMKRGDPRYDKIFWEYAAGKAAEFKGGEAMAEAFKALIEAMKQPESREVVIDV